MAAREVGPLWPKQAEALDTVHKRKSAGALLFIDAGGGKSRIIAHRLEHLIDIGRVRLILISSTIASLYNWPATWGAWAHKPVPFIDLCSQRSEGLRLAISMAKQGQPVICIINHQSLRMIGRKYVGVKTNAQKARKLEVVDTTIDDVPWDAVVIDEIHKLKTPGGALCKYVRTKLLWKNGIPRVRYRYGLTGTGFTKRPLDVWGPVKAITGDEVFPGVLGEFKAHYTIPDPKIHGRIKAYTNLGTFAKKLSRVAVLIDKEEMTGRPPIQHIHKFIDFCPRARKLYDDLTAEGYAMFTTEEKVAYEQFIRGEPVEVSAGHVFSLITKQRQMCGGFIRDDDDTEHMVCPNKADALIEFMEENDWRPMPIIVHYNNEEAMLADRLEKETGIRPKILGSVKGARARYDMVAAAANDPGFLVKPSVGAEGIDNMQWADIMAYYSHDYATDIFVQMCGRIERGEVAHKSLLYVHFWYRNTIDEVIKKRLAADLKQEAKIKAEWRA